MNPSKNKRAWYERSHTTPLYTINGPRRPGDLRAPQPGPPRARKSRLLRLETISGPKATKTDDEFWRNRRLFVIKMDVISSIQDPRGRGSGRGIFQPLYPPLPRPFLKATHTFHGPKQSVFHVLFSYATHYFIPTLECSVQRK